MLLWDEMRVPHPDDFDPPHVRLMWCEECHRKTPYRYDMFGLPMCMEHNAVEMVNE